MSDEKNTRVLSINQSAWQRLRPRLEALNHGARFTDEQICEWARIKVKAADGGETPLARDYYEASKFLDRRIRAYFANDRRIEISRPTGQSAYLLHDADTVGSVYRRRRKAAIKGAVRSIATATGFDPTKLTEAQTIYLDHSVRALSNELEAMQQHEKQIERGSVPVAALQSARGKLK